MGHDGSAGVVRDTTQGTSTTVRSILPLITVCLLAVGVILLFQQLWLDVEWLGTAAVALLGAIARVTALYVGTMIALLYIPGLVVVAIACLVIAGRDAAAGHGLGWQLWLGGLLLLLFGLTVVSPSEGRAVVPIVLIALGAAIAAGMTARPTPARNADSGY